MSTLSDQIFHLKSLGYSYRQIVVELGCSKGTVAYYLGKDQKSKTVSRTNKQRAKHPYIHKLETFKHAKYSKYERAPLHGWKTIIKLKIDKFCFDRKNKMYQKPNFTVDDVINKFGENPVCYLTGDPINIYEPRKYQFDHIIPVSKGGDNSIDNLGLCTKEANIAKSNLSLSEFVALCKKVVDKHT